MPGYGTLDASAGSRLLPWTWAVERLTSAHDYWLASVWPDGRPHQTPVWGVWADLDEGGEALWFSASLGSRKIRNIVAGSHVSAATDNPLEPVVIEGTAVIVADAAVLRRFLDAENTKYDTSYGIELLDPEVNATVRVRPDWAFGLTEDDFTGSPTRWEFDA